MKHSVPLSTKIAGPSVVMGDDVKITIDGHGPLNLAQWLQTVEARLKALGAPMTTPLVKDTK